ncbi:MAG TPA: COX15/CtaA family protein [bacterium]|nr:COX15/CtaA family protein [bacterium]
MKPSLENRIALALAVLIFLLVVWGGVVHNTGSSLACPDWPTCYGSLMPEMKGGIAVEHGHRLLATGVGLLTVLLSVVLAKKRRDLRLWGYLAVFLVVFQGVLGGITVLYRLPTAVSTAHLATSFAFFALVIFLALRTSPTWGGVTLRLSCAAGVSLLVYLQSVLGAFMRHTGAGLVCPDLPFCYGSPWPADKPAILLLHMAHRWLGVVVALAVLALPFLIHGGRARFLSLLACVLVVAQIGLGAASIMTHLGVAAVTAHLGGAALLWAVMVMLTLTPDPTPATPKGPRFAGGRGELIPVREMTGEGPGVRA